MYFAYGANIDKNAMKFRCPDSIFYGIGILSGKKFIINEFGVATLVDNPESITYGILWLISEEDEKRLDVFEGVECGFYHKKDAIVNLGKTEEIVCFLYLSSNEIPSIEPRLNSYVLNIIHWAKLYGFPDDYVNEIKES